MTDQNVPSGPPAPVPNPGSDAPPAYPAPGQQQYPAPGPQYPAQGQQYPAPGQQYGQQYPAPGQQYGQPYGAPGQPYGPGSFVPLARPQSTGVLSWAMGFLVFIFPIGALVAGIVMPAVYKSVAAKGEIAAQNARAAANWGLTLLLATIVLLTLHFVLLFTLARDAPQGFYPIGIPITVWAAIIVFHIVLTIVGTVRAGQGKVLRTPFAIPFIRA